METSTELVLYVPPATQAGACTNTLLVDHFKSGGDKDDRLAALEKEHEKVLRDNTKLYPNSTSGYHKAMNEASFELMREDPSGYEKLNKNQRIAMCNENLERLTGFKLKRQSRARASAAAFSSCAVRSSTAFLARLCRLSLNPVKRSRFSLHMAMRWFLFIFT